MDKEKQSKLDAKIKKYIDDYVKCNRAARVLSQGLKVVGVGLRPIVDHITFRTLNVEKRAVEFLEDGFVYDQTIGVIEYENWWAKVYRKAGYPAIFIDQAYEDERGKGSLIPAWVDQFGDQVLHHIAVLVDDVQEGIFYLEKQGVPFSEMIVGGRGTDLRQVFSIPEQVDGKAFSVLELTERHHGYQGFLPPQADGLMESTRYPYSS